MKKTLSVVLAALLLCTLCVVFAAADEPTASDYVFGVDNVNALEGETTNIYTHGENLNAWAVIILLDKVEDNLYKVSGAPDVGAGDPRNITLADGQILLVATEYSHARLCGRSAHDLADTHLDTLSSFDFIQ